MRKTKFLILIILLTTLASCYREKKTILKQKENVPVARQLIIDTFSDSLVTDRLDYGCTTMYSPKRNKEYENVFVQGSAHGEGKLISFMKIDGVLQIFYSSDKDIETLNDTLFITKLSNENYDVEVKTKVGRYYQGSDSTAGTGTIKITRKKDKSAIIISFEGGTAC